MDLAGLTTYAKYGGETLFGKVPRRVLEVGKRAGKTQKDVLEACSKQLVSVPVAEDMNAQVCDSSSPALLPSRTAGWST